MLNRFNLCHFNKSIFLCVLIISFTSYSLPLRADWSDIIGVSPEVESVAKLMKLVDKLKKLKRKTDKKEAYKLTKKIKKEIEELSGEKLSYSKGMKEVEVLFKNKGIKVSHAQFKAVLEDIKSDGKKEGPGEIDVPIQVTIGVVMCLCGVFLMILPFPGCKELSGTLIVLGIDWAGGKLCEKYEETKQKDRSHKYIY